MSNNRCLLPAIVVSGKQKLQLQQAISKVHKYWLTCKQVCMEPPKAFTLPSCRSGSFIGFSRRDFSTPWVGGRKVGFIVTGRDISTERCSASYCFENIRKYKNTQTPQQMRSRISALTHSYTVRLCARVPVLCHRRRSLEVERARLLRAEDRFHVWCHCLLTWTTGGGASVLASIGKNMMSCVRSVWAL